MTTAGKVLVGGIALTGVGAVYYFFFYRRSQQNAQKAANTIEQTIQSLTPKPSQYEGKVIREGANIRVYLVKDGMKHLFTSPDALHRAGFDFSKVISLSPDIVEAIPTGSDLNGIPSKLLR